MFMGDDDNFNVDGDNTGAGGGGGKRCGHMKMWGKWCTVAWVWVDLLVGCLTRVVDS
jgi:hypothetical protein